MTFTDLDKNFMLQALQEAQKAFDREEVPVGAVLVFQNKIIARGHNQTEMLRDPTAHAEMLCITAGANYFNGWRLLDTTLYTTLEPCVMCAGAILEARIPRVVWAAPDKRLGANGSWLDIFQYKHPMHGVAISGGLLSDLSSHLMQQFFRQRRKFKDQDKYQRTLENF